MKKLMVAVVALAFVAGIVLGFFGRNKTEKSAEPVVHGKNSVQKDSVNSDSSAQEPGSGNVATSAEPQVVSAIEQTPRLDQATIARAVSFQAERCRQLDAQVARREMILDRTNREGPTPKDILREVLSYRDKAKRKKVHWREYIRNEIADIKRTREDIANNRNIVLPSLNLRGNVGDSGVVSISMMVLNEESPTKFYGLTRVGREEDAYDNFVVVGWRLSSLPSGTVELPRDIAKLGPRPSPRVRVFDIKDIHTAIQGSLSSRDVPTGPQVRDVGLRGVARISSTTMVKNAWGATVGGSRESRVIEFVCTEDELKQAVMAAREVAKKNDVGPSPPVPNKTGLPFPTITLPKTTQLDDANRSNEPPSKPASKSDSSKQAASPKSAFSKRSDDDVAAKVELRKEADDEAKRKVADAAAHRMRGLEQLEAKNYPRAIEAFSKAIELSPSADNYSDRAIAHFKAGHVAEAKADSEMAEKLLEGTRTKEVPKAITDSIEALTRAIRTKPTAEAYAKRATAHFKAGNFYQADLDRETSERLAKSAVK